MRRKGYYGTESTKYRQMYEFVLWARISLPVDKRELNRISEEFFATRYPENGMITNIPKSIL